MENKDAWLILIVIFILGGLAYGPAKQAAQNPKGASDSYSNNSSIGASGGIENQNADVEQGIKNAQVKLSNIQSEVNEAAEKSKRSLYYGKIHISYSGPTDFNPSFDSIYLSTDLDAKDSVNITGWYFKSDITNYYVVIGGASILPFPYTQSNTNVILQQNDRAIINKGFSPIGISFRTNKCIGYLQQDRKFYPSLSYTCPLAENENLPQFSSDYDRQDECVQILENLPMCYEPSGQFIRDLPDTVSSACKTYLKTQINYNTCVAHHLGDTDFPGHEYRIYLNKLGSLWRPTHDTIRLYDKQNLVVDTASY